MEDEDLRVGVRHLDRERVQQVVGVATVVQAALQLGNIPEKDLNFPPNCLTSSTLQTYFAGRSSSPLQRALNLGMSST